MESVLPDMESVRVECKEQVVVSIQLVSLYLSMEISS